MFLGPLIQTARHSFVTKREGINIMIFGTSATFMIDYCYDHARFNIFLELYRSLGKLFERTEIKSYKNKCYEFIIYYKNEISMRTALRLYVERDPMFCFYSDYILKKGGEDYEVINMEKYCYYNYRIDSSLEIFDSTIIVSWDKPEKKCLVDFLKESLKKYNIKSRNYIEGIDIYMICDLNSDVYYTTEYPNRHYIKKTFNQTIIFDIVKSVLRIK